MRKIVAGFSELRYFIKTKINRLTNFIIRRQFFSTGAHGSNQNPGEYTYITVEEVIEFNELVTRQAGLLRDKAGLESAIMRPQMAAFYEDADITKQTVLLIDGIAIVHAFVDGNKRAALLAGVTFLDVNGYKLLDSHNILGQQIEQLIIGRDVEMFTKWLQSRIQPL